MEWTAEKDAELIERYPDESNKSLARDLGRSPWRRVGWLKEEERYLAANYAEKTNAELAVELKKTRASVAAKAFEMGLKKTRAHKVAAWRKARGL